MNNYLKIFLILFGIGIIAGIGTYIYVFHKPHRNLANEEAAFVLQASDLYNQATESDTAYVKFDNKAIEVHGAIVSKKENGARMSITLFQIENEEYMVDEGVNCSFDSAYVAENSETLKSLNDGDSVKIQGQFDGYIELTGVNLSRCVIKN